MQALTKRFLKSGLFATVYVDELVLAQTQRICGSTGRPTLIILMQRITFWESLIPNVELFNGRLILVHTYTVKTVPSLTLLTEWRLFFMNSNLCLAEIKARRVGTSWKHVKTTAWIMRKHCNLARWACTIWINRVKMTNAPHLTRPGCTMSGNDGADLHNQCKGDLLHACMLTAPTNSHSRSVAKFGLFEAKKQNWPLFKIGWPRNFWKFIK